MKKTIFILAALFAATFASAELIPEYSVPVTDDGGYVYTPSFLLFEESDKGHYADNLRPIFPFFMKYIQIGDNVQLEFLNPFDYTTYKTLNIDELTEDWAWIPRAATYDIFAENKLAFLFTKRNENNSNNEDWKIIDEDGVVLLNLLGVIVGNIAKYGDIWKMDVLIGGDSGDMRSEIYSLPGDGSMPNSSQAQAISTPSSPKHSARKIVRERQVLVETESNTYDLRGQEAR